MPPNRPDLPPAELMDDLLTAGLLTGSEQIKALGGGRSNLVWRMGPTDPLYDPLVLKLYPDGDKNPLFSNDAAREVLCLDAFAARGLAPRLRAHGRVSGGKWVLYHFIPGQTWRAGAAAVARLLGDLHKTPVPRGLPSSPSGSRALERQTRRILDQCGPRAAFAIPPPVGIVELVRRPCLIHGDPVPGNIIDSGDRLVLIDWQCPSHGDPSEDLALFLSPAMQHVYRGAPLPSAEEAAFLNAYPDPAVTERYLALKPWFHLRMAAYCLWQSNRGQKDYETGMTLERDALSAA